MINDDGNNNKVGVLALHPFLGTYYGSGNNNCV